MSDELALLDATDQAALVARGELQPAELVEAGIRRVEARNPELNALIHFSFERARDEAGSRSGPFRGVPFAMKDIGGPDAGQPNHCGMRALRDAGFRESEDGYLTRRFKNAGLEILGRTNTPELALLPTTECEAYGPTRSPWDPARSAGGSSGGAASAVAAGLVPAAHASDGGGSIRGPASMCGLVGLKPTRGRNSFGPSVGERWSGLSAEFVVTRTVRDSAALLDVTAGPEPGDPYHAPPAPDGGFAACLTRDPGRLRVGVLRGAARDIPVDPAVVAVVDATARALEARGHHVEESHPEPLGDPEHVGHYVNVVSTNVARALDAWGARIGRPLGPKDVEPLTGALAERGATVPAPELLATIEYVHRFGRRLAAWWQGGFDLLVCATQADPPPELGVLTSTPEEPLRAFIRSAPYGAFTLPFNLSGQPAISVPGEPAEGDRPIGVQLVALHGREDLLLQVAGQLEQDLPWRDRRPRLHA